MFIIRHDVMEAAVFYTKHLTYKYKALVRGIRSPKETCVYIRSLYIQPTVQATNNKTAGKDEENNNKQKTSRLYIQKQAQIYIVRYIIEWGRGEEEEDRSILYVYKSPTKVLFIYPTVYNMMWRQQQYVCISCIRFIIERTRLMHSGVRCRSNYKDKQNRPYTEYSLYVKGETKEKPKEI